MDSRLIRTERLTAGAAGFMAAYYVLGIEALFWLGILAGILAGVVHMPLNPRMARLGLGILGGIAVLHSLTYVTPLGIDARLGLLVTAGILTHQLLFVFPLTDSFKRLAYVGPLLLFGGTVKIALVSLDPATLDYGRYPFWNYYGFFLAICYACLGLAAWSIKSVALPRGRRPHRVEEPPSIL